MRLLLLASLLLGSFALSACGDDDYGIDLARPDLSGVAADLSNTDK